MADQPRRIIRPATPADVAEIRKLLRGEPCSLVDQPKPAPKEKTDG